MSKEPQYVKDVDDVSEQELEGIDVVEMRNRLRRNKARPLTCLECIFEMLLRCHPWKIIPSVLVSNAVSFSITTLCNCTLMHRKNELDVPTTEQFTSFGLWSFRQFPEQGAADEASIWSWQPFQECVTFDAADHPANFDPVFRTARAMGILACCFGFLTACMLWLVAVVHANERPSSNWRFWTTLALLVCCLFEGLSLVVLRSRTCDGTCELGRGGETVVVACLLYFVSAFIVFCKWGSRHDLDEYEGSQLLPQSTTTSLADEEEPLDSGPLGMMTMMMMESDNKSTSASIGGVNGSSDGHTIVSSRASLSSWFGGRSSAANSSRRTMEMAPLTANRSEDETDVSFARGFMESFEEEASLTLNTVARSACGASVSSAVKEQHEDGTAKARSHLSQQRGAALQDRRYLGDSFQEELTPPSSQSLPQAPPPPMENERKASSLSTLMMSSNDGNGAPSGDEMSTLTESSQSTGATSSEAPRGGRQAFEQQHNPSSMNEMRRSSVIRASKREPTSKEKLNDLLDNAFQS